MRPRRLTLADLQAVVAQLDEFWDGRPTAFLHQALFVHELGEEALAVDGDGGELAAYLLAFVTPARVGFIHAVAVRRGARGRGLARLLYETFEASARERGAASLKAITHPSNEGSVAFHRALGFDVREVPGYSEGGDARMVFTRKLG